MMEASEIQALLDHYFGKEPDFDPGGAKDLANALASTSAVVASQAGGGGGAKSAPTPTQEHCYADCQKTRDKALAAAVGKGWPFGALAAAAAITAFNSCRHNCDLSP
jgi:hypothetical protein